MTTKRPSRISFRLFGALLVVSGLFGAACASSRTYVWASQLPMPDPNLEFVIRPGDRIQIAIASQDTMSGEFDVRPSGDVVLPAAGRFIAAGKLPDQLAAELVQRLRGVLADPKVSVLVVTRKPAMVSVLGEVKTPGRYQLTDGETMLDALARAGGLTTFADDDAIFLIQHGSSTPRVRFRYPDLAAADPRSIRFPLRDGDIVIVE
jgi:polysaccharide export outer membrane protein